MEKNNIGRRRLVGVSAAGVSGVLLAPQPLFSSHQKQGSMIKLGVNMEFVRHHDKPFTWGVEKAKEIGWRYDVCQHSVTRFGNHKASFAEKVIEPLVLVSSKVGDLVYDPFMGSGTTGVVAKKHGRRYLGSEIVEKHVTLCETNGLTVTRRDGTES